MYIHEAVKKAAEQNGLIVRKGIFDKNGLRITAIKPTNSYDTCILVSYDKNTKKNRSCRNWNPTQDDLMADDWGLLEEKSSPIIDNCKLSVTNKTSNEKLMNKLLLIPLIISILSLIINLI